MGINAKRRQEIEFYLSKENLLEYLEIYSANYIAKKLFAPNFITTAGTVIDRAKSFGIKTHTSTTSSLLESVRSSYIETCLATYGVNNVSKSDKIKTKKLDSAIEKFGVTNVFQSEDIKAKSRQTCIAKYGTPHVGTLGIRSSGKLSKFHNKISQMLKQMNIPHLNEVPNLLKKYNKDLNKEYSPIVDILISNVNLVIECYGNFWHANPKFYNSSDIFNTWTGKQTAEEIWNRDQSRLEQIKSFGYNVLIIWESEYNSNKQDTEKRITYAIKNCKTQNDNKT